MEGKAPDTLGQLSPSAHCQFDWSGTYPGDTSLGASVRMLPERLTEVGRCPLNMGGLCHEPSLRGNGPEGRDCCATMRA